MGLGDLIRDVQKAQEQGQWLKPYLLESLISEEQKTIIPDMWMSPSVISDFCPRAWALAYHFGIPLVDQRAPDNRYWMDIGTAMHRILQESWFGPAGLLKGGWKCPVCLTVHGFDPSDKEIVFSHGIERVDKVTIRSAVKMPKSCTCHFQPSWRETFSYVEPLFYDLKDKICGWCDGIIEWPSNVHTDELVDFKIIKDLKWVKNEPNESHVRQLSLYMSMSGINRGRIMYVSRSEKHLTDAIVEHPFALDEEVVVKEKEKVRGLRKSLGGDGSIPDCPYGGSRKFGPCDCTRIQSAI